MNNEERYIINNIEEFTNAARVIVFKNFGGLDGGEVDIILDSIKPKEKEELDQILTQEESVIIVKDFAKIEKNRKTKDIRYIVTEKVFMDIIESLNTRMVSNMLNGLVNKGMIETAFDTESNDFVFWVKEDENKKQKPETD
jgi:hypothetical protein